MKTSEMMDLYIWPSDFGLLSIETTCLQCMVATKMCVAPIKFVYSTEPWKSPNKTLPYLDVGKYKVTQFDEFVEILRNTNQEVVLDSDLIPAQLCEFDAYNSLLKQKLLPALLHFLWIDSANYNCVTQYWYSSQVGLLYGTYYLERQRKAAEAFVSAFNKTPVQLTVDAIQVINLLSAKLSDNKFFCGNKPCSLDALIFGYLAPLLRLPLPNDRLQLHIASCTNLFRFVESIISIYLPPADSDVCKKAEAKKFWTQRKADAQKILNDGRLRYEQKKMEREQVNKDSSVCETILFALGAVTLSVLFAAHTGIIQFTTGGELPMLGLQISRKFYGFRVTANFEMTSAQCSARSLVLELFAAFERRLIQVGAEELDRPLSKMIKRNEDSYMDNLLKSLSNICDVCLPAVLDALIKWYTQQQKISLSEIGEARDRSVKRTLAASYLFCVTLIEILPQIHYHPHVCEAHAYFIVNTSFTQIAHQDPALYVNNYNNSQIVADAFAEVVGVLSKTHSYLVQKVFVSRLQGFRRNAANLTNTNRNIISLLTGIKYFRINTSNIAELEMGVTFLDELGTYYLEIDLKQKELKHRMAFLLVEILSPICGIKMEANIPSLIAFVEKLYGPTYELINKKQHKPAAYPLLTCLLCISQTKFFIPNWVPFLNLTLANLKNKDPKITRMALESLYRLLWVYIIRNNCEANTTTRSRLESICGSLFPRGNRNVIPRNASTSMLIKIIHVISQQKLDFVFKEIIFDLLGCNRAPRSISIYPERMNIGMRALMVIVDGLRQKEGPPEMPQTLPPIASCSTQRNKKIYLTSPLTADLAAEIGLEQYYQPCRKAFDGILRALDTQVSQPFLLTNPQIRGKEYEDVITAEITPKLDLFRTCVASIPRLLPDPMSHQSLIEMLIRLSVHVEEELRSTACTTLQNLITECANWRIDIIMSFMRFITNNIPDTYPLLLESVQEIFLQLVGTWKSLLLAERQKLSIVDDIANESVVISENVMTPFNQAQVALKRIGQSNPKDLLITYSVHCVEGLAFIMLCQLNAQQRRNAILLLNETRQILSIFESSEAAMITVLEEATPYVVQKYIQHVPLTERQNWPKDFVTVCDHICRLDVDKSLINNDIGNEYMRWDPWACALSGYCEYYYLPTRCPTAVLFAWPSIFNRMCNCYQYIDPSNPQNESRSSLLRTSKNKLAASTLCKDILNYESYLSLWQKYLVVCCALVSPNVFLHPPAPTTQAVTSSISTMGTGLTSVSGSFSPNGSIEMENSIRQISSSINSSSTARTTTNAVLMPSAQLTLSSSNASCGPTALVGNAAHFFQKITNMLRLENMTDMRDSVVLGVGSVNPACFDMLLEELHQRGIFREAQDKKMESNVRRRKRKDLLRLQLIRILEFALFRGVIRAGTLVNPQTGQLVSFVHDFIKFISDNIQYDTDRDVTIMNSLRQHFAKVIKLLINDVALEKRRNLLSLDLRHDLFMLLFSWCARILANDKKKETGAAVECNAVEAMCALSCCGNGFETRRKNDEQYLYRWLEALVSSSHQTAETICEETLCIVLHLNEHMPTLFEHIIQLCYTKPEIVVKRCFRALAMLFSSREYPCEFMTLFVLCQMFSQNQDLAIKESSLQLLHILRRSFLDDALSRCVSIYLPQGSQNLSPSSNRKEMDASRIGEKNVRVLKLAAKSAKKVSNCKAFDFTPIRSDDVILEQLSLNYSQLTMPIFSEVCYRINDARPNRQTHLLKVLLHWVKNVQLSDHNCDINYPTSIITATKTKKFAPFLISNLRLSDEQHPEESTGSEEATQLLLNNMFYLTFTLNESHYGELAALWQNIATSYSNNLPIILHYLWIMVTLAPDAALPVAKKILINLLTVCGESLIEILVDQLTNSSDPFRSTLMRSDMSPYYRWAAPPTRPGNRTEANDRANERQSSLEDNVIAPNRNEIFSIGEKDAEISWKFNDAKQLPMPPYGGYNAKLSIFLPPVNRSLANFSRENLALCLLCDLIGSDRQELQWKTHLSMIVHVAVISLDAKQSFVRWSARRALLNTCLITSQMAGVSNMSHIATILLYNQLKSDTSALAKVQGGGMFSVLFADGKNTEDEQSSDQFNSQPYGANVGGDSSMLSGHLFVTHQPTLVDYRRMLLCDDELFQTPDKILIALVNCLSERQQADNVFELWPCEDVNMKRWKWDSINSLSCFVRHLAEYFLTVDNWFVKNWTAAALDLAFRTTNRHSMGRSLHVASALCQPPNTTCISRILSKLVDLLDDTTEEGQDKIMDIVLFLINITRFLQLDLSPTSTLTTNVAQKSTSFVGHCRSISCTTALLQQLTKLVESKSPLKTSPSRKESKKDNRHSLLIEHNNVNDDDLPTVKAQKNRSKQNSTLSRSKSATNLNVVPNAQSIDDPANTLSHILYIAIAIMDSSSDSIYVLALHLLNQVFVTARFEIARCLCNLKHLSKRLGWMINMTGIVPLICKGIAYSLGSEVTLSLLAKCSKLLNNSMIVGEHTVNKLFAEHEAELSAANRYDDCSKQSFAMIIVAVLPHCMMNFRNHKLTFNYITQAISAQCTLMHNFMQSDSKQIVENPEDHPLSNLAMMMDQYQDGSFQRNCFQWAKCVVKYLVDALNPNIFNILIYLTEVLEKNDLQLHVYVLNLMNHFVAYGDLLGASEIAINAQIVRTLLKYLQIEQCNREVACILKSFVDKGNLNDMENEMLRNQNFELYDGQLDLQGNLNKYRHGSIISGGMDATLLRRNNAKKIREKLVFLLDISGPHFGLQKSSSISTQSVTNNQVSDYLPPITENSNGRHLSPIEMPKYDLDLSALPPPPPQSKLAPQISVGERNRIQPQKPFTSSNENLSGHNTYYESTFGSAAHLTHSSGLIDRMSITTDSFPRVFKEFDFLEAERDSISESTDSCFNWSSTMRSPRGTYGEDEDENIGDEHEDEDRDDGDSENNREHMPMQFNHYSCHNRRSRSTTRRLPNDNPLSPNLDRASANQISNVISMELSSPSCRQSCCMETPDKTEDKFAVSSALEKQELYRYHSNREKSERSSRSSSVSSNKTPIQMENNASISASEDVRISPNMKKNVSESKSNRSDSSCELSDKESEDEEHEKKQIMRPNQKDGPSQKNASKYKNRNVNDVVGHDVDNDVESDVDNENYKVQQKICESIQCRGGRNHPERLRRYVYSMKMPSTKSKSIKSKKSRLLNAKRSINEIEKNNPDEQFLTKSQTGRDGVETSSQTTTRANEETLESASIANAPLRRTENWVAAKKTAMMVPRPYDLTASVSFNDVEPMSEQRLLLLQPLIECDYHTSGKVESTWKATVALVSNDLTGEIISSSFILFSQILKECRHRLSEFLRDAVQVISAADAQRRRSSVSVLSMASQASHNISTPMYDTSSQSLAESRDPLTTALWHAVDVIANLVDNPILFITPRFLQATNAFTQIQFDLYELQEHFDVFCDRREQCIRLLNAIQSSAKSLNRNNFVSSANYHNQESELSKCLHKLSFQLFLLYKKLYDTAKRMQNTVNSKDYDLAPALANLQQELHYYRAQEPTRLESSVPSNIDDGVYDSNNYKEMCRLRDALLLNIANKQYNTVFGLLYKLRTLCGSKFGCCEQTDVNAILLAFCRGHLEWRAWGLIGDGGQSSAVVERLADICNELREMSAALAAATHFSLNYSKITKLDSNYSSHNPPSLINLNVLLNSIPPIVAGPTHYGTDLTSSAFLRYDNATAMSAAGNSSSRSFFLSPQPSSTLSSATAAERICESANSNADAIISDNSK